MAKKSKNVNFNINTEYRLLVHRPYVQETLPDGKEQSYVLYAHSDSWKENKDSLEDETKAEQSEAYKEKSKNNYNSPTNIRRVFITGRGVGVQYYLSPIINGKAGETKWTFRPYTSDENLFDIADKIFSYNREMRQYENSIHQSSNGTSDLEPPNKYNIRGNVIGLIGGQGYWVCSNIEELYFDWTALLSNDVIPYFNKTLSTIGIRNIEDVIAFTKSNKKTVVKDSEAVLNYFTRYGMSGVKDLESRFPRLRTVAMVSNLDEILKLPKTVVVDQGWHNIEAASSTWLQANKDIVEVMAGLVLKYSIKGTSASSKYNTKFIVRDGIYKFDDLRLRDAIESYKNKINEIKRAETNGVDLEEQESIIEDSIDKTGFVNGFSNLELTLLAFERMYNKKVVSQAFKYAAMGKIVSQSELQAILSRISKSNRKEYCELLKLPEQKETPKVTARKNSTHNSTPVEEAEAVFTDAILKTIWAIVKGSKDGDSTGELVLSKYNLLAKAVMERGSYLSSVKKSGQSENLPSREVINSIRNDIDLMENLVSRPVFIAMLGNIDDAQLRKYSDLSKLQSVQMPRNDNNRNKAIKSIHDDMMKCINDIKSNTI